MNRELRFVHDLSTILQKHKALEKKDVTALQASFEKSAGDISFEEFLLDEGVVSREDLLQALSEYYQVPSEDVIGLFFDHHFLRLIPKNIMKEYAFIPYERDGDIVTVIAAHPDDQLKDLIEDYISNDIEFRVGFYNDILESIDEYYDRSNTYQPNQIAAERMERSMGDVHPSDQQDRRIPEIWEDTDDDYEAQ